MATVIDADRRRVWRAISDPNELVAWDTHLLAPIEAVDRYPTPGSCVRWRYRLESIPLVMHDKILEVSKLFRLRRKIRVGSLAYDQTLALADDPTHARQTRLSIRIVVGNSVPLFGETIDRFRVRELASNHADEMLRCVRDFCEETR